MLKAILIGYFPKRTAKRPDWLKAAVVEEICSVSDCISKGPDGWIDHWRHNDLWVYDTAEIARSVIPTAERREFDMYAYRMLPVQFTQGSRRPFEIPSLHVQPVDSSYEPLGWDIVSRSAGNSFECSPLSCNHMAEKVTANRYCLLDDLETLLRLAGEFETGGCEPRPYYVVEVWGLSSDSNQYPLLGS